MTVAVTGATGLVGSRLVSKLVANGHTVRVLTRNVNRARGILPFPRVAYFRPDEWEKGISGSTGVVNLAGEPISTRWTNEIKAEIKASRVSTTRKVVEAIGRCSEAQRPKVLVSASAVGYYGISQTASFNESSGPGSDFLAQVCQEWEAAAEGVKAGGVRLVIPRIGIVLAKDGGAIGRMMPIFQLFSGGPLGSGKQWCSWIHRDDLVSLLLEALTNEQYQGVVNAVAPNPVRMAELCSALGKQLGRPSWLPVPDFALKTMLGEGAAVVLEGQRVLPAKAGDMGFSFRFGTVDQAMANVVSH